MTTQLSPAGRKKSAGFQHILLELKESVRDCPTFGAAAEKILTFDGRLPLRLGIKSLSARESAALELLRGRRDFVLSERPAAPRPAVIFGVRSYGRLILGSEPVLGEGDLIFGHVPVGEEERARIAEAEALASRKLAADAAEIDQSFSTLTAQQLDEVVTAVEFMVDHVDPVLIYVGDATFSVFGKHNNLLDKRGCERYLFECLRRKPYGEWGGCEKVFIYCMYWLRQAGARAEEFNGLQLNLDELHRYLDGAARTFDAAATPQPPPPGDAVPDRAARVSGLKSGAREGFIIYRRINGLTFHKEESLLKKSEVAADAVPLPWRVREYLARAWDVNPERYATLYELFSDWFSKSASGGANRHPEKFTPAEELMHVFVAGAVEELRADIGMTRCIREPARIKIISDALRCAEACAWPISDFYCCVVPSEELRARARGDGPPLAVVLTAVAKRMEYNSWHYLPGHFSPDLVPDGRHFYFPPAMPDLTEWSNQHHTGHVLANVLHCIRSPGPLTYAGRDFPGFLDIRLMRQEGEPFTLEDLKRAIVYTRQLKEFYQAMLDYACGLGAPFKITAFTKAWYEEHYNG